MLVMKLIPRGCKVGIETFADALFSVTLLRSSYIEVVQKIGGPILK